jgi:alpha-L-rhamnosidase
MKNMIFILALLAAGLRGNQAHAAADGRVLAENLRCEYRVDPLGIDVVQPRLSWADNSEQRAQRQTAYEILVATSREALDQNRGNLWDSGKVVSDESIQIAYAGAPLVSGEKCFWKVRLWDGKDSESDFSPVAVWSMGLLKPGDFKAKWIGRDEFPDAVAALADAKWIWLPGGDVDAGLPAMTGYFRHQIELPADRTVKQAICEITADNDFTLEVNGKAAASGNDVRAAAVVDVSGLLHAGTNTLSVTASNNGKASGNKTPKLAGVIASLRIEFTDGSPMTVVTDEQWQASKDKAGGWGPARIIGPFGMTPWVDLSSADGPVLPARMVRKEFALAKPVARATAYVCGLGLFEMYLNGAKVGDHVLDPALTDYDKRDLYETFDVTSQLKQGTNAIGVILGNGRFYSPRPKTARGYGQPRLLLQVNVEYADGSTQQIISDESWKLTSDGPIRANNEYDGEEYDARKEMKGWSEAGFDDSGWAAAQIVAAPAGVLAAQDSEPMRVMETIHPVAVKSPKPGQYVFDMGQNMVGWCRLSVNGPAGTVVRLRHAERLNPDGTIYVDNMRTAKVTDVYTLSGHGDEVYEPRFTYHGFRYVEVTGFPGAPALTNLDGRVVYDSLADTGSFECSNALLNQIYHNIYWGTRGNYRSIPTDCPQRDERQGWLGDRSAECWGESFMFDLPAFYTKWLNDIRDDERPSGSIPDVAPRYWSTYNDGVVWPSTYVIIPHMLYERYGDQRILAEHYDAAKKWTDYMSGFVKDGIMPNNTYGDWCVPPESPELIHSKDPDRQTPGDLLSSAYFYYDLGLMRQAAKLLNKPADEKHFADQAAKIKDAFNAKFLRADKNDYGNGSQTSTVLPLAFGMVPAEKMAVVFQSLVEKITSKSADHIGTGLVGGQWLMRVLSDNGRADLAYQIATQKTYPSWGYMVSQGATTVWELWNGNTADPAMNSGNHVMLIGDLNIWFYEYLAGIRPDADSPGFKHVIIEPKPVGDLTSAQAHYDSIRGTIASQWKRDGTDFSLAVSIPANCTASVYVPASDAATVRESGGAIADAAGVKFAHMSGGYAVYDVQSGIYSFTSTVKLP